MTTTLSVKELTPLEIKLNLHHDLERRRKLKLI